MLAGQERMARWNRIQEAMAQAGLTTQTELARALEIKQPSVSAWATGEASPSLESMVRLAEISGMCLEYLAVGRGPRYPADADEYSEELRQILDGLDEAGRAEVIRFARFRTSS